MKYLLLFGFIAILIFALFYDGPGDPPPDMLAGAGYRP